MNKKGVSIMVGYILLVVFAIVIGAIVFQWLRTYVPTDSLDCPDGTSISVVSATLNDDASELSVTLRNNGRFGILGYFIHATNESDEEMPTINIAKYFSDDKSGSGFGTEEAIFFGGFGEDRTNPFSPNSRITHVFEINQSELSGDIHRISILPRRQHEVDGRIRSVSCSNARVEVPVSIILGLIIFVSGHSKTYEGGFGGISKADKECRKMASDAGLEGDFISWLSDDNTNAKDRIGEGSYVLVNGTKIADSKSELLSGTILNQINLDQDGIVRSGKAWTGTDEFGVSTEYHCDNWSSNSTSLEGTRGGLDKKDSGWTNVNTDRCDDYTRIYCFQLE